MYDATTVQPDTLQYEIEQRTFITKVYGWMSAGLLITAIVAYLTATTPALFELIFGNPFIFFGLVILEFILVAYLTGWINKMSAAGATVTFLIYSAINGLTLASIFIIYDMTSIYTTFLITAGVFGIMSLYGYLTKSDLTTWGNLLMMLLVGLILSSFVNLFIGNEMVYWITTYVGIITFVGLTAYDTQKIKNLNVIGNEGTDEDRKEAIIGALSLYLDFINLFLYLLRLFGRRK